MERRKSEKNLKSFAVSFLTLALVLTTVLLPVGGVNTQNVAYAATEGKVTLETTLKTLDETTSDKVELTISAKENATEGVSGIQFNVSYPKEFDLIKKTVGAYFDNGVSFFGPFKGEPNVTETARPMFCGFGSHGTDADKREFTDKESGKLVTLVFEANQQLTQGKSYEFSILDDRLTAFLLKTNEDAQPETKYLTIDKGAVQTYTPKNAGGTITENTKITQAIDEKGNAAVKQQVIAAAAEKGDPITDVELICQVVASSQSLIPDQNPNDSMYAAWHIRQESFPQTPTARQWTSSLIRMQLQALRQKQMKGSLLSMLKKMRISKTLKM